MNKQTPRTRAASTWPLLALVLKDALFPERPAYAPIDAGMLARYRFFRKLGFFGIDSDPRRGAVQFLRASGAVTRPRGVPNPYDSHDTSSSPPLPGRAARS